MEQVEEMRKTYREREQTREDRINKMERQLEKIYRKLLSIEADLNEAENNKRIKEIEVKIDTLNDQKKHLEYENKYRFDKIQDGMNWFSEK